MLAHFLAAVALAVPALGETAIGFTNPIHGYATREPEDRLTRLKREIAAGRCRLETTSEQALLVSLLEKLAVPVSSQMLVFSATSLQTGLINPRNPRALYFNEDTYVGFVPGGRLEVISIDPQLGPVFHLFDALRGDRLPRIERSSRCMNCHAPDWLREVPGLIVESMVPGITGGGEKAVRREHTGHETPLELRFGGWHLTGTGAFTSRWAGRFMEYTPQGRVERLTRPGEMFDLRRYPVPTSDLLAHLLHEHQVGFENRAVGAAYQARVLLHAASAPIAELDAIARPLVRYILFADEAPLPPGGVAGDAAFKAAFLATRRPAANGASLKDLDLRTRLLRYRCSYMIYSPSFAGLPAQLKERVLFHIARALDEAKPEAEFAYLPVAEKRAIRGILRETLGFR